MKNPCFALPAWILQAFVLLMSSLAWAGPEERVQLRALDRQNDRVLVETLLGLEERVDVELNGQTYYLALKKDQLRGREVLNISLAEEPDEWRSAGSTALDHPSRQAFGDRLLLELEPEGWAGRFCGELDALADPAVRDAELSLQIDGETLLLSQPGWDGASHIALLELGGEGGLSGWTAGLDDGRLRLNGPVLRQSLSVSGVRQDFPLIRDLSAEGIDLQLIYVPADYPPVFCAAYRDEGKAYAARVADYFFGR